MSDAFSCVSEMCTRYGYSHFLIAHPPDVGCPVVTDDIILTNLPLYVVDDLVNLDLFADWSIIAQMDKSSAPFAWADDEGILVGPESFPSDQLIEPPEGKSPFEISGADALLAAEIDARFGHCIQAPTRGQKRVFISLFAEARMNFEVNSDLVLLFLKIFNQVESVSSKRVRDGGSELNKRELECLNWAAAGKTSGEIAVIVSLSEHTVNHYLNSCCKKLDCVNRTQAVARAIRMRVIK